ncbi:MAG: glycoside hydrolase family 30 beta sandwich domain-containing protein [Bariatricus sp.]
MKAILYTTTEYESFKEHIITSEKDDGIENEVLNIYPHIKYQTFDGFGGAITDAAGYVFSMLSEEQKGKMISTYFDPNQMGYTHVRIPVDSCDFSTHMFEADPYEEDEKLQKFSFADTETYIIPFLKAAEKIAGKKLKIMLSAWSPPAYMKTNHNRKKGGSLKPEYRKRWAEYLCRYIEEFRSRGFEVERMSVQNEPKAAQQWDSCVYTAEEEKIFLRDYLAPALKEHGMDDIEIFIWDHNKERVYERASEIIDETTNQLVDGIAFHWYSGDHFEALDLVRQMYPDKKLILSESCLEFGKYDKNAELENAGRLAHDMIGNLNHGMTGFYDWNLLLDSEGGPNHTANYCEAPYMFDIPSRQLKERKCLEYYRHFAGFIKKGARRLACTRYTEQIDCTAWENEDSEMTFILLNRSEEERKCHLRISGEMFIISVPSRSIVSGKIKENII